MRSVPWPSKFNVIIAGIAMVPEDLPQLVEKYDNIAYLGEYRSPEDLQSLYERVDIVWACYPFPSAEEFNWRWARTNRFYESCQFKKPMIALKGSGDAYDVEKYGIGMTVENNSIESVAKKISEIQAEDLKDWGKNIASLPEAIYTYTTEVVNLEQALIGLLGSRK